MIGNLFKAAVGVALMPVAVAIDIVTLPASAMDPKNIGPFQATETMARKVSENVAEALK